MGFLGKLGGGFKWLGKNMLRLVRRNETLLAVKLAAGMLPIPALEEVVSLVRYLDGSKDSGTAKMAAALEALMPILDKYGVELEDESKAKFLLELAVQIMKGNARVLDPDA